ncbi:MAG: hypothetical protein JWS10_871 [Cypionkella sp.]|uniref:hypothetical protein n=1 Tax=Cypionkella sp. TaxID=2811411 RepID=UPI0026179EB3|nr:hypothetical protein [Cypionkella sp.]MDB5658256.1 hypothetical protein [Cypionkella sp.]
MSETYPEEVVADAMEPIISLDVPLILQASIKRHGKNLMELATSLLDAGIDELHVRSVIGHACSSYRDELITAILRLGDRHEI